MGQQVTVFAIVAIAAAYAAWKLLPSALTRRLASAFVVRARGWGVSNTRLDRWQRRVATKACGACDACNGCAPTDDAPTARPRTVIPLERI